MITNVIAFLSSIATAILVGVGIVSLNIKYKNTARLDELTGFLASLINTANTQSHYTSLAQRFANLQETYYVYKQSYTNFLNEQAEALELLANLKKLLYVSIAIWVLESVLILISGKNLFEYSVATVIIIIVIIAFVKFATKFKFFVGDFSFGSNDFPKPETLLIPTRQLEKASFAYISPQLPLNFMEAGLAIELDPPRNPEVYLQPVNNEEAEQDIAITHDYASFFATGRLLFSFNYKFKGQLHFYTKHGEDGHPFAISSEYFKAGFSNIYDIGFSYYSPIHHLDKIVLSILTENSPKEYATITFIVPPFDELPNESVMISQPIAKISHKQ